MNFNIGNHLIVVFVISMLIVIQNSDFSFPS